MRAAVVFKRKQVNSWLPHKKPSPRSSHGTLGKQMLFVILGTPPPTVIYIRWGTPVDNVFIVASQLVGRPLGSSICLNWVLSLFMESKRNCPVCPGNIHPVHRTSKGSGNGSGKDIQRCWQLFCMKGAGAGPSPAIFNWPLIKSMENGDGLWSELSGGVQQTQPSVKFSVSSGEPHLRAFLYEERCRGSLEIWRIINVSPFLVPPKVQDVPFPDVGIAYFHHQNTSAFSLSPFPQPSPTYIQTLRPEGKMQKGWGHFSKTYGDPLCPPFAPSQATIRELRETVLSHVVITLMH